MKNYTQSKKREPKFRNLLSILLITFIISNAWAQSGEVVNLGLYGGHSIDFAWAYSTNRLFSAVETPASIFYSDDNCATWTQPFPNDSLEYETSGTRRGWGGRAFRVVSNLTGWVGVVTSESGGTLTSSVISYNDGDSASFTTAYDGYLLNQMDPSFNSNTSTSAITISDSWFYVGLTNALIRVNDTSTYGTHNILIKLDTSSVVGSNTYINWLAVSSNTSGYPILMVANAPGVQYGKLFSYDGTTITEITGIPATYGFERVFVHPEDNSLDTLIVSALLKTGNTRKVYLSLNSGVSWSDITPPSGTNWALQNADYSPNWVSQMPISNGLRLSFPGVDKSDDLGATWSNHMLEDNASATHPTDTSKVVGSKNKGPQLSLGGAQGTFTNPNNDGHAAVSMNKIAQSDSVYYVSTKAGLGYTTAYFNPAVQGVDQWKPPYGDFPISNVGGDGGISSVAIDPADSLHVIAGSNSGFHVTTTGPAGFSNVTPADWDIGTQRDVMITDIKFVSSDTIVAVSGTGSNALPNSSIDYGNIWLSTDGGNNWTKNNPSDGGHDFEQGNTVVVGFGTTDTIIYIGCGYYDANNPKEDGQLWTSDDFGATWSYINGGPTGQGSSTTLMPIYDMDVNPDPDSNQVIYIASGENLDYAFVKTIDGGATYNYISGISPHGAYSSVLVNKTTPEIVSVAARRNLFRYNTIFNSSTTVFTGLPGEFVPDLETGSTLLATTTGLYKLIEEPGSVTTVWNGTGDWSDNTYWSNGVPYDISNAIIQSGVVSVDISGKANDVTIRPTAAVTVSSGEDLTINGNFTLESDLTGYASFIDDGSIVITGDVSVERYITEEQWHYITPPISDAQSGIFTGLWLEYWDEPSSSWITITSATEDLLAGKGYKTWASGGTTGNVNLEFIGIMNSGNYSPAITLTGDPETTGWNMVGNDFPSAIDWGTDNSPNPEFARTNIDNTIYFWTGSQYATYNPSGNSGDGEGINGGTQYIASMQGFFIHANAASPALTIPQSSRLHHSQDFRNQQSMNQTMKLVVYSSSYSDEIIVSANEMATNGFDIQYDAYKLYGINSAPQLYSITDNDILAVNHLPMIDQALHVPIGFIAGSPETHSIVSHGTDSFNDDVVISLEDTMEDLIINLKTDSVYTYMASPNDDPNRFILHIDDGTVGITEFDKPIENLIYYYNGSIIVENTVGEYLEGEFKVYDLLGRLQFMESFDISTKQFFEPNLVSGTYIAMICNNTEVQTKKLIIK